MLLRILQGAIFNDNAIGSHAFQKENSSLMFTFKISGHWKLTAGFYNNHWKSTSFSEIIITLEAAKSYQNKYPSFLRQPSSHFGLPFLEFFFFFFFGPSNLHRFWEPQFVSLWRGRGKSKIICLMKLSLQESLENGCFCCVSPTTR